MGRGRGIGRLSGWLGPLIVAALAASLLVATPPAAAQIGFGSFGISLDPADSTPAGQPLAVTAGWEAIQAVEQTAALEGSVSVFDLPYVDQAYSVTFNFFNAGPSVATDVVGVIELPDNYELTSLPDNRCNPDVRPIVCSYGDLGLNHGASTTLRLLPRTLGPSDPIVATFTSDIVNPNGPLVLSHAADFLAPEVDLGFAFHFTPTLRLDVPFAFNLGVTNFGPATANDVLLTVDIPPTLDIAIDDPSLDNCEHVDTQVECRWDSILAGSFRTDASLLLTARSLGEVRLTASVTSSTPEVDPDVESNQFGRTMSVLEAVPGDIRGSTEPDLAGTLVLAYRDRDGYVPTAFTVIGADGQFNLADIPGGRYRLLFYPPAGSGYALEWTFDQRTRADADRITLRGDGSSRVIGEQRLEAEATVTGSVESPSGGAIPAAAVALYRVESPWVPLMWVKTDTRGGFRFDRLPEGRYQIVATPPGDSSRWWGGPNRAGATVLDLGPGDEITAITFVF